MKMTKKAEIKYCVTQFTDVMGLDKNTSIRDPEEYANIIKDITKIYDETINLYDGHIDKHEGRIFMATFGVPIAHEEDPERAIKSALLLKHRIEEYNANNNTDLAVRVGINLGRVYAGDIDSDIKKDYTVMGDAVNLAARIMEQCRSSQILVNEEIHSIAKPVFQFSDTLEIQPQGLTEKIKVFEVTGQKSGFIRRRGIEGLKSPLIGRAAELAALKSYLENLLKGEGNTVTIIGEAGVGKSRLIEELFTYSLSLALEQAKVVNWYSGYCSPYKETAYLPFVDIIKQVCGIDSGDSEKAFTEKLINHVQNLVSDQSDIIYPYVANLLNLKLGSQHAAKIEYLEPKARKLQTHVAISSILKGNAQQKPCVYVIDDLYLTDIPTLEALKFFLETNDPKLPILLILLSRPDKEKAFWQLKEKLKKQLKFKEINLARLKRNETLKISENLLRIPKLPASLVNDIVAKSDGNPFFLEEIIKLLIAKKILYKKGQEWLATAGKIDFSIPYTIEAVIRTRFDTMKPDLQSMLEEISVIGRNFKKRILKGFSKQWEHLDELLQEITELGFISANSEEEFSFNHALIRTVIYSGIPEKRRKSIHLKIGETIEALFKDRLSEFYEILFEHFVQTAERDKKITYGLKAAEKAQKRYANQEAMAFYEAVLEELETQDGNDILKRNTLTSLGKINSRIGNNNDAQKFLKRALTYCKDPKEEADVFELIANSYQNVSDYEKAISIYNTAMEKLSKVGQLEKSPTIIGLAWIYYLQGDYVKTRELLEKLLDSMGESAGIEERKVLARIYNILASVHAHTGKRQKSFEYYNKALKIYEILEDISGQSVIYNNICGHYDSLGDYPNALRYLEKALEIHTKTGNMLGRAIATYNIGNSHYLLGNFERAEHEFNNYLKISAQINNRLGNGYGNWGLGLVQREKDNLSEADRHFTKARSSFEALGSKVMALHVMLNTADLYRLQDQYEKSWEICEDIIKMAREINAQEIISDVKQQQAKTRITQAFKTKRLAVTFLEEAKQLLLEVKQHIEQTEGSVATKFEVYFDLSQVYYHLGNPEGTMKFYGLAQDIQTSILAHIKDENAQRMFLQRRSNHEFTAYKKTIKV